MIGARISVWLHAVAADIPMRAPALLVVVIVAGGLAVMIPLDPPAEPALESVALAIALAIAGAYALARINGVPGTLGPALIALALIVYVRDQFGGGNSGLAELFMIPVIWLALYAATWEAIVGITVTGVAMVLPTVVGDPLLYDTTEEMRRLLAFLIVASIVLLLTWWMRRELLTDPLTRAGNRRAWDQDLHRELARAARSSERLVVAIIDLDRFKQYNDRNGHMAGDRHLSASARAWREVLRREDFLVRAGGEEFFLLLPRTSAEEADAVLNRVRARTPNGQTCSIGHATWDGHESAGSLLHRADQALYRAKASGRDRVKAAPPPPAPHARAGSA